MEDGGKAGFLYSEKCCNVALITRLFETVLCVSNEVQTLDEDFFGEKVCRSEVAVFKDDEDVIVVVKILQKKYNSGDF